MPALHRLQQAFVVFEDQEDSSWARPWSLMERAWPEIDLEEAVWEEAAGEVVQRFLHGFVFATLAQLKDGLRLASRVLKKVLEQEEHRGALIRLEVAGLGEGWMRVQDRDIEEGEIEPAVFMLHRADPLVQAHLSELKQRFGQCEVLQYLLVDGELRGAVCGHWRIGPHDVEDIVLDVPDGVRSARKEEVLAAVSKWYGEPRHRIVRYAGVEL